MLKETAFGGEKLDWYINCNKDVNKDVSLCLTEYGMCKKSRKKKEHLYSHYNKLLNECYLLFGMTV